MILKKCINGSMILIDGVSEAQVYERDKIFWVKIQRGKETETHRLDEPTYLLNDEGKTIERLPYYNPQITIKAPNITAQPKGKTSILRHTADEFSSAVADADRGTSSEVKMTKDGGINLWVKREGQTEKPYKQPNIQAGTDADGIAKAVSEAVKTLSDGNVVCG